MSRTTPTTRLDLSRDEQWLVHHIMLDHLGFGPSDDDGSDPFVCTLAIVEKIERDRMNFTRIELDQIRSGCRAYAESDLTPAQDVETALGLAKRIDGMEISDPTEPVRYPKSVHRG